MYWMLILLAFVREGIGDHDISDSYNEDSRFSIQPATGEVGGEAEINCYFISEYYYTLTDCKFAANSNCNLTFYEGNVTLPIISNDAKYRFTFQESTSSFCQLTSKTNATIENITKHDNTPVDQNSECLKFTLTIKNLNSGDLNKKYACGIKLSTYDPVQYSKYITLYGKGDTPEPTIFYYQSSVNARENRYYDRYDRLLYQNQLFQCGFYNTFTDSVKWNINMTVLDGNQVHGDIDDIAMGDFYTPLEFYSVTKKEGMVVESLLRVKGLYVPHAVEIYCRDTKSGTRSGIFYVGSKPRNHHLEGEYGFFYWIFTLMGVIPGMAVIVLLFAIFASVRGQVCSCCRRSVHLE